MKKSTGKHIIIFALSFVITLAATLVVSLFFSNTTNYKMDKFSFDVSDYNKDYATELAKRPYVKIKKHDSHDDIYNGLFNDFYYGDECGSVRLYMDNDCRYDNTKVTFYTQKTLSILTEKSSEGGYRLDYGLFHTYFSDKELGGSRTYLGSHFGCTSYIFISDIFANQLCDKYGLEKNEESYLKLINEEKYAVLKFTIDGTNTVTLSINNILYSNLRNASRMSQFNPNFGVINHWNILKYVNPCIELDFKSYSYYIKMVLNRATNYDYTVENSDFSFYRYSEDINGYKEDTTLNKQYLEAMYTQNNILWVIIGFTSCALIIFGYIFLLNAIDFGGLDSLLILIGVVLVPCIMAIISAFTYTYFLSLFLPLLAILVILIMKGGNIYHGISNKLHFKSRLEKSNEK